MPTVGIIAAIGATAASATSGIYGANKQSESNAAANATTNAASERAMALQKEQDAQQKQQFDANIAEQKRQWDATQSFNAAQWNADQARRAPYRAAGAQALVKLGDLIGTHFNPGVIPQTTAYQPMPFNGSAPPTAPNPSMAPSSAAPFAANAPMAPRQTVKLGSLMPQGPNAMLSPAAQQMIDPVTGQPRTVVRQ